VLALRPVDPLGAPVGASPSWSPASSRWPLPSPSTTSRKSACARPSARTDCWVA
jgi:hypothetical protein